MLKYQAVNNGTVQSTETFTYDDAGNLTDTGFAYDTYGKLTTRTGSTATPFLYNGRDGVMSDENGIVLPFIYVGKGKMTNPRKQVKFDKAKGKNVVTYLYDIVMENELPDYLQYDFGLTK